MDKNNQYQQMFEILFTFRSNKYYAYLLNVELSNFVFLKIYTAGFDDITITLAKQNGRPLETDDK